MNINISKYVCTASPKTLLSHVLFTFIDNLGRYHHPYLGKMCNHKHKVTQPIRGQIRTKIYFLS